MVRQDGASGHLWLDGGLGALHEGESAFALDGLEALGTVAVGSRQDDTHGVVLLILGDRAEEAVDGGRAEVIGRALLQMEEAAFQGGEKVRQQHVHVVGQGTEAVFDGADGHLGLSLEQIDELAIVVGGEVGAGLAADLPAAVFLTLHTFGRNEIFLPDLLNAAGPLRAALAVDGEAIENGRIYIAPPDYHLLFSPERLYLGHGPKEGLQRPSINVMFRSAAANFGERTAGVVLTGMLDDGAAGLWEILQRGGVTVVQDPEEAAYRSMPESAIRGVNVHYILRLNEMAPLLARLSMGERRETQAHPAVVVQDGAAHSKATATHQACPQCGGVMVMEQLGGTKEYNCHVGHRLGLQSMIADKTEVVERRMWAVLSQSEELVALLREPADGLDPVALASLQEEILARRRDIETMRAVIERSKPDSSAT